MSSRATTRNQRVVAGALLVAVGVIAAGQLAGSPTVSGFGRVAYAAGLVGVLALLPPVGRRQLRWAGPRLIQLGAGMAWWIGASAALALAELTGQQPPARLIPALALGGIAQILVASLAYFGPVLRAGGHERLTAGFATTRSWASLIAGNVAAVAVLVDLGPIAAVALAVWAADLLVRGVRLHVAGAVTP